MSAIARVAAAGLFAFAATAVRADTATSSTARSNAAAFAFDGTLKPLSLRTN